MDGGDIAPATAISSPSPGPGGHIPSRASSALAAVSVALGLLYLLWSFIWPYTKHVPRNGGIIGAAATSSSLPAPRPSCPSLTACVAGEAARCTRETSPLPVFVHVTGAEKAECAVCLVEFGHGEAGRLVPGCGHGFHAECIEKWFRVISTCPLCRGAAVVGAAADHRGAGGAPRL